MTIITKTTRYGKAMTKDLCRCPSIAHDAIIESEFDDLHEKAHREAREKGMTVVSTQEIKTVNNKAGTMKLEVKWRVEVTP